MPLLISWLVRVEEELITSQQFLVWYMDSPHETVFFNSASINDQSYTLHDILVMNLFYQNSCLYSQLIPFCCCSSELDDSAILTVV